MNLATCLGFQLWYYIIPSLMLSVDLYEITDLISPRWVQDIKNETKNLVSGNP